MSHYEKGNKRPGQHRSGQNRTCDTVVDLTLSPGADHTADPGTLLETLATV